MQMFVREVCIFCTKGTKHVCRSVSSVRACLQTESTKNLFLFFFFFFLFSFAISRKRKTPLLQPLELEMRKRKLLPQIERICFFFPSGADEDLLVRNVFVSEKRAADAEQHVEKRTGIRGTRGKLLKRPKSISITSSFRIGRLLRANW